MSKKHIVIQTSGRAEQEKKYNAFQIAGHGAAKALPVLKRWGFNVVAAGGDGYFGTGTLIPGTVRTKRYDYAYVQLPDGWQSNEIGGYERERVIKDPAGRERVKTFEFYGHDGAADSPSLNVTLVDRFNIVGAPKAETEHIFLEDNLTGATLDLMKAPDGADVYDMRSAVEHGLYKALVKNWLTRSFTLESGVRSGPDLSPLWDRVSPLLRGEMAAVAKYAQTYKRHSDRDVQRMLQALK